MSIAIIITMMFSTSPSDHIDEILEMIGLTKETARISLSELHFMGDEKYRLQCFDMFMNDPYKIPDYTASLTDEFITRRYSFNEMLMRSAKMVDVSVRQYMITGQMIEFKKHLQEQDGLYASLIELYDLMEEKPNKKLLKTKIEQVPIELVPHLSLFIFFIKHALKWHDLAFKDLTDEELELAYTQAMIYAANESGYSDDEMMRDVELPLTKVNYGYLYMGALYVSFGLDSMCAGLKRMDDIGIISISIPTPLGDILINGTSDDIYTNDEIPFLVIDFGGNDEYLCNSATIGGIHPFSIIIDLYGDDSYRNDNDQLPSFGGALFNYSFLLDFEGNDFYKSMNVTQGAGLCGVGVLYDEAGDDSLFSRVLSQGAGCFGLGMLINIGGSDYYEAYQQTQGFGFVKGCGILIDDEGNDLYVANDSDIAYPSPQSKDHNASFAQGMGCGKRADLLDGNSLAGGVGLLIDKQGNDTYKCGVFGQGCGLWYGCGFLSDKTGNDDYYGACYVQGCGVHFSVSVLLDNYGNDKYTALLRMAQGVGKDFTIGFFIDGNGDDHYIAPSTSLGIGQANSIGIFWDKSGDDIYEVENDYTLGFSEIMSKGGIRDEMLCLGLFMDGDGKDIYSKPFAKNKHFWIQARIDSITIYPVEKFIGVDF